MLEKLTEITAEHLILEVASFAPRERRKHRVPLPIAAILERLPVIYVAGSPGQSRAKSQTFFITPKALTGLLLNYGRAYSSVDIYPSGHKGRYTAIAHKRKIGHLLIVAGTPTSGKSTLTNRLLEGELERIAKRSSFSDDSDWIIQRYSTIEPLESKNPPNVLLEYNISHYLIHGDRHYHDQSLLDMIRAAQKVSFITLWNEPSILAQRYKAFRQGGRFERLWSKKISRKSKRHLNLFGDPTKFSQMYIDWFAFVARVSSSQGLILQNEDYEEIGHEDWVNQFGALAVTAAGGPALAQAE